MADPVTTAHRVHTRCRLCSVPLRRGDDPVRGLCNDCQGRPEAARLNGSAPAPAPRARAFTAAEQSLIRALHGHMAPADLLRILNERMTADLGPGAPPYTLEQLHREIGQHAGGAGPEDWTSLRRLLGQARASGLLATITPAMLDDFAIVFRLSEGQATQLKDAIRAAQEDCP